MHSFYGQKRILNLLRNFFEDTIMNKLSLLPALLFAVGFYSVQAQATVPGVETIGRPASTTCPVPVAGATVKPSIKHFDKVIFQIIGQLKAADPVDQPALLLVPPRTDLDIKILDNPTKVADLKSKVLTFLGAIDDDLNRQLIEIKEVEYTAVVCPQLP